MKILITAMVVLVLAGCSKREEKPIEQAQTIPAVSAYKPMTNDEIISETKKCEAAGLGAESLTVPEFGGQTVLVQCHPLK